MTLVCSCPPYVMNRPHQERRLLLGFLAATVLLVVELFGGFLSGSLAIMSDALHLASGIESIIIMLINHIFRRCQFIHRLHGIKIFKESCK